MGRNAVADDICNIKKKERCRDVEGVAAAGKWSAVTPTHKLPNFFHGTQFVASCPARGVNTVITEV